MDKIKLVEILRSDRRKFQSIRDQDPKGGLDLSGVDLSGADLTRAPLAGVNLSNACLKGADCTRANLRFADLSGADLRGAKLVGANLHRTVLERANLEGALLGEDVDRETRMCLNVSSFRGTRLDREELETMLGILNENERWEIRYRIVPKGNGGSSENKGCKGPV